jgi:dienelactone hydrolase
MSEVVGMYYKWLDRWDERRAAKSDQLKQMQAFALDADLAFSAGHSGTSLAEFCALSDLARADPSFFADPSLVATDLNWQDEWIKFESSVSTGVEENDLVWAKVTKNRPTNRALIVFHHWNATSRSPKLANFFSRRGIAVVEMAMPYHLERHRSSSSYADYMLSPNLGRTIQSVRQAVLDGRKLIRVLNNHGYEDISVLGMSLGSWIAALIAAHEPLVRRASLFLSAGSLADMVWTGRATRHIRASLESKITLNDLRRAWAPLNVENYAKRLTKEKLSLQFVLARRDTVVMPELSKKFVEELRRVDGEPSVLELNCGHYSLSMPPHIIWAGLSTLRFLSQRYDVRK